MLVVRVGRVGADEIDHAWNDEGAPIRGVYLEPLLSCLFQVIGLWLHLNEIFITPEMHMTPLCVLKVARLQAS